MNVVMESEKCTVEQYNGSAVHNVCRSCPALRAVCDGYVWSGDQCPLLGDDETRERLERQMERQEDN